MEAVHSRTLHRVMNRNRGAMHSKGEKEPEKRVLRHIFRAGSAGNTREKGR
jgi:hypothetical protein